MDSSGGREQLRKSSPGTRFATSSRPRAQSASICRPVPSFAIRKTSTETNTRRGCGSPAYRAARRSKNVLINIEAAERSNGKLLFRNAGVLFFAKRVRRFIPEAYITCLLARGTDKVNILDRKDFDGGIVADIEDTLRFVERNTRTAWRIEGLRREDVSEYPMKALREAVTNAVIHRDWFFDGANVFVEIYAGRIEVVSPGGPPKGLTLAELEHKSVRRNALIADLVHRIGFIEKAGTGIRRIREDARTQGCPEPGFHAGGFFTATFRPNPEVRAGADVHSAEPVTGEVTGEIRLLRVMEGEMTRRQIQEALDLKHEDHFRKAYLLPALQARLIELTIPDKPRSRNQRHRLTPTGHAFLRQTDLAQ